MSTINSRTASAAGAAALWIAIASVATPFGAAIQQTPRFAQAGSIAGPFESVRAQGQYLYAAGGRTLTAFDVSDPGAPQRKGSHTFPEEIWSFRLFGSDAYVGVNFFGLGILNVSNPSALVLKGSFKTPGQAKTAALFGSRVVIIDHMEGLVFADVSNPQKPAALGSFFVDGYARDVATAGQYAFAVDSPTGLYVLDLTRNVPIEPIATLQSGTALRGVELTEANGRTLAVAVGAGALQIYDVTTPSAPEKGAMFKTPGGAVRIALKGSRAYVADAAAGLQLVDLSTPSAPVLLATHKTTAPARDVAVGDGGVVFVVVGTGDIQILKDGQ